MRKVNISFCKCIMFYLTLKNSNLAILCIQKLTAVAAKRFCFVTMRPLHSCQGLVEWTSFFPTVLGCCACGKKEDDVLLPPFRPRIRNFIAESDGQKTQTHVHPSFRWTWLHDQLFWVLKEFGCHIVCPKWRSFSICGRFDM